MITVLRPAWAIAAARLIDQKVLPSHSTDEVTLITLVSLPSVRYCKLTRNERNDSPSAVFAFATITAFLSDLLPCVMVPMKGMGVLLSTSWVVMILSLTRSLTITSTTEKPIPNRNAISIITFLFGETGPSPTCLARSTINFSTVFDAMAIPASALFSSK